MSGDQKLSDRDFCRERKLSLPWLITFVLHLAGAGKTEGVDIQSGDFFNNARRSGVWPQAQPATRGAMTRARKKVRWQVFEELFEKAVRLALELWPDHPEHTWHGLSVLAIDGSKYRLPATEQIRQHFDPGSGLNHASRGHYPLALVSTLYDVFRGLPLGRTVVPNKGRNERVEALKLLQKAPAKSVTLFDRGYPSYELFLAYQKQLQGYYLMRCSTTSTFVPVVEFMQQGAEEAIISIPPSDTYRRGLSATERRSLALVAVRAIRGVDEKGEPTVFLTNLLDARQYPAFELQALYLKRWKVEEYYREEKVIQEIETFHSRNINGVMQELYAVVCMTVISRTLAALTESIHGLPAHRIQKKNAVIALAREAAILVPEDPQTAVDIFRELLEEMKRVKYYPPKQSRPPQPRISKTPENKWQILSKKILRA